MSNIIKYHNIAEELFEKLMNQLNDYLQEDNNKPYYKYDGVFNITSEH